MKVPALFLLGASSLIAGELCVVTPNDDGGFAVIERMSDAEGIESPEPQIQQEEQIALREFKNLKPDKYRVSYIFSGDPLGYRNTIMETHVRIREDDKQTVYLFQPWNAGGPKLPKDVMEFLEGHRTNFLELDAVYDDGKKSFEIARGGYGFIHSLRADCEYHLKVWNHSYKEFPENRKVIFEKTFRAVAIKPDPLDPFGDPQKTEKSEQPADGKTPEATQPPH